MPRLTRLMIRSALLYLIAGVVTGALYWLNTVWAIWPPFSALNPVYIHFIVIGWLTQLAFGVIYWMFPIISKDNMRGNDCLAWAAFITLNAGLLLRAASEPWLALHRNDLNAAGLVASALLLVLSGYLLVFVSWPRVRQRPGR